MPGNYRMLEMAQVTKDDVLYDLGCGDGRIVIAAAKKYGSRGVGVDIDPQRIKESKAGAPSVHLSLGLLSIALVRMTSSWYYWHRRASSRTTGERPA